MWCNQVVKKCSNTTDYDILFSDVLGKYLGVAATRRFQGTRHDLFQDLPVSHPVRMIGPGRVTNDGHLQPNKPEQVLTIIIHYQPLLTIIIHYEPLLTIIIHYEPLLTIIIPLWSHY